MHVVTELDGFRVLVARSQHREFGMAVIEPANIRREFHKAARSSQIGVALRAGSIAGAREPQRSLVFDVTAGTSRHEGLIVVMDWTVVTGQARRIGSAVLEAGLCNVARAALLSKQGMHLRNRTRIVRLGSSLQSIPAQPTHAGNREDHGQIRRQRGIARSVLK